MSGSVGTDATVRHGARVWSLTFMLVIGCVAVGRGAAQDVSEDSVRIHHTLGEIVIGAYGELAEDHSPMSIQRLPLDVIAGSDAPTIDGFMRRIPGTHLQTNSRGETLAYIRGAGERQLAVFFDGALLNVPWDNRVDLALIPTEVVGEMVVSKSVPSVLYGTNVLGGALNMTSRELRSEDGLTQVAATGGSQGARRANVVHMQRHSRWRYGIAGGWYSRDAVTVPQGAFLPYGQLSTTRRANSDLETRTVYGRIAHEAAGGAQVGLSFLRMAGKIGVAPEGHLDPAVDRVRYWRYPTRSSTMLIGATHVPVGDAEFRGTVWASAYEQDITQYRSLSYSMLQAEQQDRDLTFGTRLSMRAGVGRGELDLAINALTSVHDQTDVEHEVGKLTATHSYRQHVWSAGAEYIHPGRWEATFGASLDGIATPQTGGKPARAPQIGYGLLVGVRMATGGPWTVRAVAGRKVRFPTMRELFGEALGRFLVNENLKPESSLSAEVAAGWNYAPVSVSAAIFLQRTYDTIDQRVVHVDDKMGAMRQRVNLDGSRVTGLEINVATGHLRGIALDGNITWLRPVAFNGPLSMPLAERPDLLGHGSITYRHRNGASLVLEAAGTGRAHGLAEDNSQVPLTASIALNGRIAWLAVVGSSSVQLFTRVNNITDEVVLPQLGLPAPGREVLGGLEMSF